MIKVNWWLFIEIPFTNRWMDGQTNARTDIAKSRVAIANEFFFSVYKANVYVVKWDTINANAKEHVCTVDCKKCFVELLTFHWKLCQQIWLDLDCIKVRTYNGTSAWRLKNTCSMTLEKCLAGGGVQTLYWK